MTDKECVQLLIEIRRLYSGKQVLIENPTQEEMQANANALKLHFSHFTGKQVHNALHELISSREPIYSFADLIGALKQQILKDTQFPQPSFEKVWRVACKKCSRTYGTAKENYNSLPLFLRKVYGGTSFLTRLGEADETRREFLRKELLENYEREINQQKQDYLSGKLNLLEISRQTGLEKQFLELRQEPRGFIE